MTHRFTERQARKFIAEQHREQYDRLLLVTKDMRVLEWPRCPSFVVTDSAFRHCGQYSTELNVCKYSLPYCVFLGEEYRDTIQHELAHAFAWFIMQATGHGSEFKLVMSLAKPGCDVNEEIYHRYPLLTVERVADELREIRGSLGNDMPLAPMRRTRLSELTAKRGAMQ